MWTRQELKQNAKQILRRTYWSGFLTLLVLGFLVAGSNGVTYVTNISNGFKLTIRPQLLLIVSMISIMYTIFLSNILMVGKRYYFLHSRVHDPEISNIFVRFGNGNYGNVMVVTLIRTVKIFLWTCLFIIPGIIKTYEYWFVDSILAENPTLSQDRVFELSRAMSDGIKFQIFVLQISFVGWYLLGIFACGIGTLFVGPYYEATMAELYMAQRAKVMAESLTDFGELGGF